MNLLGEKSGGGMSIAAVSLYSYVKHTPFLACSNSAPAKQPKLHFYPRTSRPQTSNSPIYPLIRRKPVSISSLKNQGVVAFALLGAGCVLAFAGPSLAALELPSLGSEPSNALSLPTWAIHVSSVVEWVTAMVLVWKYGDKPGLEAWKGLSWGMVPLLGGALCACTWHFFYNAESLDGLVVLQAALTVIGNATMCTAAYRIYKSREPSQTS